MFNRILFLGRDKCNHTNNVFKYLKKRSKKVFFYKSKKLGEKISIKQSHLNCDYIFSFKNYFILKKKHIKAAKYGAINFHPATPKYRGLGPVNFSIYNQEKFFGCTAHMINEKIDNGKILDVKRFKVRKSDGVEIILNKTYKNLEKQAKKVINKLLISKKNLEKMKLLSKKEKWSNKIIKRKGLESFYRIDLSMSYNKLNRKILATKYKNFKPYIVFKKKKFKLIN